MYTIMNNCVSTKDWIITILLLALPIVGFIMLLVWAFGGTKDCRSSFAKAVLIWYLVGIVLAVIGSILFSAVFASLFSLAG